MRNGVAESACSQPGRAVILARRVRERLPHFAFQMLRAEFHSLAAGGTEVDAREPGQGLRETGERDHATGSFQRIDCQSNSRPSRRPRATMKANRSSSGRLKATSNGTPFLTK